MMEEEDKEDEEKKEEGGAEVGEGESEVGEGSEEGEGAEKGDSVEEKDISPKTRKEFLWVLGVMGTLILVLVGSSLVFQSLNTFEHEGLAFTKEKFGDLLIYHYYYYYNYGGEQFQYNLYLRNDPRKNRVPITGDVIYDIGEPTFFSIDVNGLGKCPMSNVAVS